jgi:hypothetical protein
MPRKRLHQVLWAAMQGWMPSPAQDIHPSHGRLTCHYSKTVNVTPACHDSQGAHVPLTGLGVGNGLTAPEIQYKYYSEMAYKNSARPLVSKTVYEAMKLSSAVCLAEIRKCQDKDEACNAAFELCALTQVPAPDSRFHFLYKWTCHPPSFPSRIRLSMSLRSRGFVANLC